MSLLDEMIGYEGHEPPRRPKNCQRWIPVGERLPEEDENVVVYTEDGTHIAAIDEDGVWYPSHGDGWMFPIVSHWTPLPAPPADGN